MMNTLPAEKQVEIIAALTEGVSIRATERLTNVHRDTVMRLGVRVGEGCQRLHDAMFRNLNVNLLQLDEIWSFIQAKQGHRKAGHPAYVGDCYTWIAFDSINKAVIAYRVGKRSWEDCREFIWDLRNRVVNRVQITSDGYAPYAPTIRAAFGYNVDYGQLQKIYEGDTEGERDAAHRYSPGRVVRIDKEVVYGNTDQHQSRRAKQPDAADADAALHAVDERVQPQAREPPCGRWATCGVVQPLPRTRDIADNASHGAWGVGAYLVDR